MTQDRTQAPLVLQSGAVAAAVTKRDYFPSLTGLRGVAASWVLLFHAWQFAGAPAFPLADALDLAWIFQCGYFGVDLFFILSGFLLALPFHRAGLAGRPMPSLKRFWTHRCRRVLPALWLQILVLLLCAVWLGIPELPTAWTLFGQVTLSFNILPGMGPSLNPVYWSMPVEWNFYAVLPLLALLALHARAWLGLALVVIASIAFRWFCHAALYDAELGQYLSYPSILQLPSRLDQFFFGVLAALVHLRFAGSAWARNWALLAGLAGLAILVAAAGPRGDFLVRIDAPWLFVHYTLVGAALALVVFGAAGEGGLARRLFANRALGFVGLVSYSLYLWHYPALVAMQKFGWLGAGGGAVLGGLLLLGGPLIVFLSWLSFRFVERPFLRETLGANPPGSRLGGTPGVAP